MTEPDPRKKPRKAGVSKPKARAATTAGTPSQRETGSRRGIFTPDQLDKSVIALPLLQVLEEYQTEPDKLHAVVIDLNLEYPNGMQGARRWITDEISRIVAEAGTNPEQGINLAKSQLSSQYLFARLEARVIRELVKRDNLTKINQGVGPDQPGINARAIHHIWPDFKIRALIDESIRTVKADAAHSSFAAFGEGIVWAVLDSGIDAEHLHFKRHGNLTLKAPLKHEDFTGTGKATQDALGHGTHVAGIIAGEMTSVDLSKGKSIQAFTRYRDEHGGAKVTHRQLTAISGMAPKCKLVSLKVLDENGEGEVSNVLSAIAKIQEINSFGRRLLIHGVNMSIGYDFEPEWFACGQSPLCREVDRLVNTGVVVVVAAGNAGYGLTQSEQDGIVHAGLDMTIGDPGNADSAITVGSTHRDSPHVYGVSYFSSKGPTGDGRAKPDLVAPGERILSCAAGKLAVKSEAGSSDYVESSGTSMAAPHVSGVIAAFLSIRQEFIGQPDKTKQVFLTTATDLRRDRYFQGSGLIDLMRAIQSV